MREPPLRLTLLVFAAAVGIVAAPLAQLDATLAQMGRRQAPFAVRMATTGIECPVPATAAGAGR